MGYVAGMQLTPHQLKHYQEKGFVVVPHFFDAREIAAIRAELERFKRDGLLRNVATVGDGKTASTQVQNLQICPLTPKSELFAALPFCPKVVAAIQQCIGDPIQHHLDQIFLKPAHHGAGTSWHQDNAYFDIPDPILGVGMWVAIHDASIANGTMHVIPGIYREKLEHIRDGGSDHHIRCYPNEDQAVAVEIEAGGALFFNYGVPHCTLANTTDHERAGLALHFLRAGTCCRGLASQGPVLTGPQAVPPPSQWHKQVERMLAV